MFVVCVCSGSTCRRSRGHPRHPDPPRRSPLPPDTPPRPHPDNPPPLPPALFALRRHCQQGVPACTGVIAAGRVTANGVACARPTWAKGARGRVPPHGRGGLPSVERHALDSWPQRGAGCGSQWQPRESAWVRACGHPFRTLWSRQTEQSGAFSNNRTRCTAVIWPLRSARKARRTASLVKSHHNSGRRTDGLPGPPGEDAVEVVAEEVRVAGAPPPPLRNTPRPPAEHA